MHVLPLHYHGCVQVAAASSTSLLVHEGYLVRSTEGSQYTPPQKEELAQLQLDGLLPRLLGPDEVLDQSAPQGQQQGPIQYIANVVHLRAKLEI